MRGANRSIPQQSGAEWLWLPPHLRTEFQSSLFVRRVVETRGAGRCSLRQSSSVLKVALPPRVLPITVRLAFLAAFSCIVSTNSFGKSASISKL